MDGNSVDLQALVLFHGHRGDGTDRLGDFVLFLVSGAALGWFALKPREAWSAVAGAAAFLTLHAAIHVFDAVCGTRHRLIEGMVMELFTVDDTCWVTVMELSLDSSDTSVITRRLIRPSVSTTGVKLSDTPNFLNPTWVVQT